MTNNAMLPVMGMFPTSRGVLFDPAHGAVVGLIRVVNLAEDTAQVWLCLSASDWPPQTTFIWPVPVSLEPGCMAQDDSEITLPRGWRIEGWADRAVSYAIFGVNRCSE